MKRAIVVAAAVGLLIGGLGFATDQKQPANEPAQGISGKVIKMTGDFMPSIGPRKNGGRTSPLLVPVHIFKGKLKPFEKPNPNHPQLAMIVNSDKDGSFRAALEPGEYTVVAEINGKLYLNCFTDNAGGMAWCTVTVEAGSWATTAIKDSSQATF
jgi:hypothetical protein